LDHEQGCQKIRLLMRRIANKLPTELHESEQLEEAIDILIAELRHINKDHQRMDWLERNCTKLGIRPTHLVDVVDADGFPAKKHDRIDIRRLIDKHMEEEDA